MMEQRPREVSEELSDAGKADDSASLLSWLFDGKVFVILYIMLVYHFFDNEKQIGGWFREAAMPSNLKRTASNPNFWITVIVLSIEHMCYTYVWKKPEHFQKNIVKVLGSPKGKKGIIEKSVCLGKINGKKIEELKPFRKMRMLSDQPTRVVHYVLIVNKAIQLIAVYGLFCSMYWAARAAESAGKIPPCTPLGYECIRAVGVAEYCARPIIDAFILIAYRTQMHVWLLAAPLIVCGQFLNYSVYKAIGKAGVYYGFKLGEHIPWYTGFPFNVVSHPQYTGVVMTWWGILILLAGVPGVVEQGLFCIGDCRHRVVLPHEPDRERRLVRNVYNTGTTITLPFRSSRFYKVYKYFRFFSFDWLNIYKVVN